MTKYLTILLLVLLSNEALKAQVLVGDTAFVSTSRAQTISMYDDIMKEQNQLYNGESYKEYHSLKDEHPYYTSEDWVTGSIRYQNELHDSVSLLYNIYTDDVIVEQPASGIMIKLVRNKVQSFSLHEHQFVFIAGPKGLTNGFYDRLCAGEVTLYAKRIKSFQETISGSELERYFIEKTKYYLKKDGHFYPVKSKKSILTVLGDRKKELSLFLRQNHLSIRRNREVAFIKMTEYYNGN